MAAREAMNSTARTGVQSRLLRNPLRTLVVTWHARATGIASRTVGPEMSYASPLG